MKATDRSIGWFRDAQGYGVVVTHTSDGCVLGFPARPGMVNEYLGTVPFEALRRIVDEMESWQECGSYERLRQRIKGGEPLEEW